MPVIDDSIIGSEKQGLGFTFTIDGRVFNAKINDPGTLSLVRNALDTTHSRTKNFKQSKPEELAEPLEWTISAFFDPTLQSMWDLLLETATTNSKKIYLLIPVVPATPAGFPGYIYLPAGYVTSDSIAFPIDGYMEQEIKISGGTENPTLQRQVAATEPTAIAVAPATVEGPTVDGQVLGAFSTTGLMGPGFYSITGGTEAADLAISSDNLSLEGVGVLTNTSGSSGVLTVNILVEDVLDASYTEVGLTYTIT